MLKNLTFAAALIGAPALITVSTVEDACAAGLGCCMQRADTNKAPWIQRTEKTTLKQCKKLNKADNSGKGDKILKPQGKIMWSIKC